MKQPLQSNTIKQGSKRFEAYPNPTNSKYAIIGSSETGAASIVVSDLLGHNIQTRQHDFSNSSTLMLDLSDQAAGIFLVKILTADGSVTVLKMVRK
jgi:hypothetical protein